jgi:threonine/homoserine/homoserine lactone efflux protein
MVIVVGYGMGAIVTGNAQIYLVIKIIGAIYLLYLAWKIANAGNPGAPKQVNEPLSFFQAAVFQWLNPKAWVTAVGALATFTTNENFNTDVLKVVFVYFIMSFTCMAIWLMLGQSLQGVLRIGNRIYYFNIAMGVALAISVIPMVLAEFGN